MTNKSLSRLDGVPWHLSLINGWITAPPWCRVARGRQCVCIKRISKSHPLRYRWRRDAPPLSFTPWIWLSLSKTAVGVRSRILMCGSELVLRWSGGGEVMQVPRSSQWRSQLMTRGPGCWAPRTDIAAIPLTPPSISDGSMGPRQPQPALLGVFALHRNCVGGDDNEQPSQWQARGAPGLAPVW